MLCLRQTAEVPISGVNRQEKAVTIRWPGLRPGCVSPARAGIDPLSCTQSATKVQSRSLQRCLGAVPEVILGQPLLPSIESSVGCLRGGRSKKRCPINQPCQVMVYAQHPTVTFSIPCKEKSPERPIAFQATDGNVFEFLSRNIDLRSPLP